MKGLYELYKALLAKIKKVTDAVGTVKKQTSPGIADWKTGGENLGVTNAFTLPAGTWVVSVMTHWKNNASGRRQIWLKTTAAASLSSAFLVSQAIVPPVVNCYQQIVYIGEFTAQTSLYAHHWHDANVDLGTYKTEWQAVRIK